MKIYRRHALSLAVAAIAGSTLLLVSCATQPSVDAGATIARAEAAMGGAGLKTLRFAWQMGADLVIAVDSSNPPEANQASDTLQILLQTFAIMGKSINQYELKDADVVVRPTLVGLKSADFSARQRAIDAGRAAMLAALPTLRAKLESSR